MSDGVPGRIVLNRNGNYWQRKGDQRGTGLGTDTRKEGDRHTRDRHTRGDLGQLGRKSGKRGVGTIGATKNPVGVNLRGGVGVIGLLAVAR